jgi:uncharacterized protein (DUF362 family)
MQKKEKVLLRKIANYDPIKVEKIVRDGLQELGLTSRAQGHITIKPNVVMAHHKAAPSAYTRPEFLEGVIRALQNSSEYPPSIAVAEKCGAGIPTTRMFRRAGYYKLKKRNHIKLRPIELARKKTVLLEKGKIHKKISTSLDILEKDFFISTPKLKSNSLSQGLTGAVKLNVGILLDTERMWNHNLHLDEKIVDLLEISNPDFIATDAIEVSIGGNQFTQHGRHLGLIIMARNAVAHDVICSHIFHLDPEGIGHLLSAHDRGYGPISLEDIEISGDTTLSDIQRKTANWDLGYIRADEVDCGIKVLCGEPYCVGGCHGVILDWLYMIKDRKPKLWKKLPPWTVVVGKYKGDVSADKLMLIGSCTDIQGKVQAKKKRKIKGCPPKHKDLVLWFFLKTGILNPLFRLDLIIDAYVFLFLAWCKRFITMRF